MVGAAKPRLEGRGSAWFGIALVGAVVALARSAPPPPEAPAHADPEYAPMAVRLPDATLAPFGSHPDMRVMGIEKAQSSDVLCSDERIGRMDAFVAGHGVGELFVDAARWRATPAGTRAGIASFFSKCRHEGEPLDVLSGPGGDLLAVYDPETGLTSKER